MFSRPESGGVAQSEGVRRRGEESVTVESRSEPVAEDGVSADAHVEQDAVGVRSGFGDIESDFPPWGWKVSGRQILGAADDSEGGRNPVRRFVRRKRTQDDVGSVRVEPEKVPKVKFRVGEFCPGRRRIDIIAFKEGRPDARISGGGPVKIRSGNV